ncbi:MAG: PKD domain-containing protein [Crocinitomicaceae bacterium]
MDKFEKIIKQAVEGYEAPFNPQAWENVSSDLGDSFDHKMKESAEGFEAPYSPAAWEAVSSQLGPAYSVWKWVAGSAAVVAAIVGTVYFTSTPDDNTVISDTNDNTSEELATNNVETNSELTNKTFDTNSNDVIAENNDEIVDNSANNNVENNGQSIDQNNTPNNLNNGGPDLTNNHIEGNDVNNNNGNDNTANHNNDNGLSDQPTVETEKVYESDGKFTLSSTVICAGEKCVVVPTNANSELKYVWNFGDGSLASGITVDHKYERAGEFTISLEVKHPNTNKTIASTKETIVVNALPKTDFTWEQTNEILPAVNFINLTDEAVQWAWNIKGLKQSTQNDFEYTFRKAGKYMVDLTAVNEYGCQKSVQKTILIEKDYNLLAPTAFSPNGDFQNDKFIPKALQIMEDVQFTMNIMDKSGELVYTTQNVNEPWDGVNMNDNAQLPAGSAYIWRVVLTNKNGEKELYEGQVIIIR